MTSFAHPRDARIRKRREFAFAQSTAIRTHSRLFTLLVVDAHGPRARLGLAVSRRVGNAVVRNRTRRVLKEMFRRHAHAWPPLDVVIIAKPELATVAAEGLSALEREALPLIERALARYRRSP